MSPSHPTHFLCFLVVARWDFSLLSCVLQRSLCGVGFSLLVSLLAPSSDLTVPKKPFKCYVGFFSVEVAGADVCGGGTSPIPYPGALSLNQGFSPRCVCASEPILHTEMKH